MGLLSSDLQLLQRYWRRQLLHRRGWPHRATLVLVHSSLVELHLVVMRSSLTLVLVRLPACVALEERNFLPTLQFLGAAELAQTIHWGLLPKSILLAGCLELVRGSVASSHVVRVLRVRLARSVAIYRRDTAGAVVVRVAQSAVFGVG